MSEVPLMSETTTVNPELSAGQLLRLAREQQGMHIAILAAHIKVPVKKVQALEADQFEEFASPVFVRSVASSICRALKVDAAPVLALLPQPDNMVLTQTTRVKPEPPVSFRPASQTRSAPSRNTLLVAAGLAVVTLLVAFVPDLSSKFTASPAPTKASGLATENVAPAALGSPVQVPEVASTPAAVESAAASSTIPTAALKAATATAPATAPSAATASVAPTPAAAPASSPAPASTATTSAAPAASTSKAAAASGVLGVTARGDSWVQVLDAQGQLLLSSVVVQGETVSLDGALPLKVVVGRVDQTEVSVRGKPFSMADIAQGNVARFEVK
jgi:cytoskeleton protein RodZ